MATINDDMFSMEMKKIDLGQMKIKNRELREDCNKRSVYCNTKLNELKKLYDDAEARINNINAIILRTIPSNIPKNSTERELLNNKNKISRLITAYNNDIIKHQMIKMDVIREMYKTVEKDGDSCIESMRFCGHPALIEYEEKISQELFNRYEKAIELNKNIKQVKRTYRRKSPSPKRSRRKSPRRKSSPKRSRK